MQWETARLVIEPLQPEHAAELHEALKDEAIGQYIGGPDSESAEQLRNRIAFITDAANSPVGQTWHNFAVLLEGKVIGRLEATERGRFAEIAYLIGVPWWGNGYGQEGTRCLLEFLRSRNVAQAWATVDPRNVRSINMLKSLNFEKSDDFESLGLLSFDIGDLVFKREFAK